MLAFASALHARTEQPGLCLASLRSPADPGAEVLFVCVPFEVDGLRGAGHDVTSG